MRLRSVMETEKRKQTELGRAETRSIDDLTPSGSTDKVLVQFGLRLV